MWLDFSSNGIHRELEMRGRRRWAQISHFGKLGRGSCEKTRRRRGKGKNPKERLLSPSHSAGTEWGRRRWAGLFVKGWVWVPPSLKLVGIKTSVSGPRMQSTKKRKVFLIKSIFQKV